MIKVLGCRVQGAGFRVQEKKGALPPSLLAGGRKRSGEFASNTFQYRGTSPIRKCPTPYDPPRTLGIGLQ